MDQVTTQSLTRSFVTLIGFILLFIALYLFLIKVDLLLKYKGIDDCGKISRYEKVDDKQGIKVNYPLMDFYQDCLKKKGL